MNNDFVLAVVCVLFQCLGIFLLFAILQIHYHVRTAWRHTTLARLIRTTPSSFIGQVNTGYAAVKGRAVVTGRSLSAPITGRPCLAWGLTVFYRDMEGVGVWFPSRDWKSVKCVVEDGTGLAEVDLPHAEIHWGKHPHSLNDTTGAITETIKRKVRSVLGPDPDSDWDIMGYHEFILQEGDFVFVMGPVATDGGRVRFGKGDDKRPLLVTHGRRDLLSEHPWRALGWWVVSAAIAAGALCFLLRLAPLLRSAQLGT